MKRYIIAIAIIAGITMISCTGSTPEKVKKDESKDEIGKVAEEMLPDLRDPSELALRLKAVGAVYLPGIGLDTTKLKEYSKNPNQTAITLGMYYADMVYALIYNDKEAAKLSAAAVGDLSKDLGAEAELGKAIKESFADSINEEQRLLLLDKGMRESRIKLRGNNNKKMAVLMVTGYYIEQFYQLLQILNNYPDDMPEEQRAAMLRKLYERVADQKEGLKNLLGQLNSITIWSADYKSFINDLERLQLTLNDLKGGEFLNSMSSKNILEDPTLIDVRRKVLKIRGFVTS